MNDTAERATIDPTCHYCFRQTPEPVQAGWDLICQCWVCPACLEMARHDDGEGWLYVAKGGEYAFGRQDPRATAEVVV